MQERKIVLASKSPRRKKLLEQIGLEFEVHESEYEEDMNAKKDAYELVKFLALKKAEDVARHYDDAIVIGADTLIVFNGEIIGKPKNRHAAREMLRKFSGKEHEVVTGLAVIDTKNNKIVNDIIVNDIGKAKVKFRDLPDEEIDNYIVSQDEHLKLAGAYGIQKKAAVLIDNISGDFYSIVGLPLSKVYCALKDMGVNVLKR